MPYSFNIELFGDKGTIRNNRLFTTEWPGQKDWAVVPTVEPDSGDVSHHPFQQEVDHFVDCIERNVESHAAVSDAVATHEICLAADRSAAEGGRPVRLPGVTRMGTRVSDLDTPALLVHARVMERNLSRLGAYGSTHGLSLLTWRLAGGGAPVIAGTFLVTTWEERKKAAPASSAAQASSYAQD